MWWGRQGFYARFPICFANLGYYHLPTVCTMPIKLRFPFVPKLVAIVCDSSGSIYSYTILVHESPIGMDGTGLHVSWDDVGKTVSWYTTESSSSYGPAYQLNHSRGEYHYAAIG